MPGEMDKYGGLKISIFRRLPRHFEISASTSASRDFEISLAGQAGISRLAGWNELNP